MNIHQFHAGETAEATVEFIHGDRVGQVTATFIHSDDPTTKLLLSGEPEEQVASGGAGDTYWRVTLSGEVTTENELGEYRLDSLEAEYHGGRRGPLGNAPEGGNRIAQEERTPPGRTACVGSPSETRPRWESGSPKKRYPRRRSAEAGSGAGGRRETSRTAGG